MRYITRGTGTNLRLLDEIRYALKPEAERAGRKGLGLKAVTPDRGPREPNESQLANWVWGRFLAMPEAQRDQFIREGKGVIDDHLRSDRPVPFGGDLPFVPVSDDAPAPPEPLAGVGPGELVKPPRGKRGAASA